MNKIRLIIIITACCILIRGELKSAQDLHQRIISLSPPLTEELYLLGAGDKIAGVTTYCVNPPEAANKVKVGTVRNADIEKIISLKPDLVLATSLTNSAVIRQLKGVGIKVEIFPQPRNFDEMCLHFMRLGELVSARKKAQEIVSGVRDRVCGIKRRVKDLSKPKVFVQIGARPLVTVTGDSFINDFVEFAGGKNITKNLRSAFCSREKVLMDNPDIIIIISMGVVGENEKAIWGRYKSLEAAKKGKIYVLEAHKLCSPTPITFIETLEGLVKIFHEPNK